MKVSDEIIRELLELTEKVVISAINAIYEYQKKSAYLPTYFQYPERFLKGIEETEQYDELKEKVPAFKYGIPFFTMSQYNNPKKYGELLRATDGQFAINSHTLEGFGELLSVFCDNPDISKMLASEEKYIESSLITFIGNIVNRYLYETQKFECGDIEDDVIRKLVIEQLIRRYANKLNVTICVPICFIEFESDEIEISDTISICKMSEKFQISRYKACHFESTQESHVVQCAGFMIRMRGYGVENRERDSLHNATSNYWSYPTEVIDDLFAAIRISVGLKTGYGQLLIEPDKWADEWTADLLPLYGTNIRAFNRNEVDTDFFGYEIGVIKDSDIQAIKELFSVIRDKRTEKKKKNPFNKVLIAIQRLNRCMLREADDDTALDAIIGIETLLSGDTHGEITYTISNRITVVATKLEECPYSASDVRKAMKTIYGLRSDIVHGRDPEKNSKIIIAGSEIATKELAIEFLRYSLLFIIRNQQYLDVKEFESALDEAIEAEKKDLIEC